MKLTKEQIHEIALQYTLKQEFRTKHYSLFSRARYHKWWDEISSHMKRTPRTKTRTLVECQLVAKKYNKLIYFIKSEDVKYYIYAKRRNWLDEITQHMVKNFKWTPDRKDEVIKEGEKYRNAHQFGIHSRKHYYAALTYGWMKEIKFKDDSIK